MFTYLTLDNEQMMVVYGKNEEHNVEINMIDRGMINFAIKVFHFKNKVFNEFSIFQYRFIEYKCQFKCLSLETNTHTHIYIHIYIYIYINK